MNSLTMLVNSIRFSAIDATISVTTAAIAWSADLPCAGKSVTPARATWNNEWVGTEIYIKALEELGYTVERP